MAKKKKDKSQGGKKQSKQAAKKLERILLEVSQGCAYENHVPQALIMALNNPTGFFLGALEDPLKGPYVGIPQGAEGHVLVVGGSGKGKTRGIAMPTLRMWRGTMFVSDIKGEHSRHYQDLLRRGLVDRPCIILDFSDPEGPSYDPFWWLMKDKKENCINNIKEIVQAIMPTRPDAKEPFWNESEQALLTVALLHYFSMGLSFSESMNRIACLKVTELCEELSESPDIRVKMILGEMDETKSQMLNEIARGFRNQNIPFTIDAYISHLFRGKREGANCVTWDDLDDYIIFLRVPEDQIDQWGAAINLMLRQLIRYFERKPDMYGPDGGDNIQTLLLLDEFPRFGKLEMISNALSTIRSKNVKICIMVQSLAQLDKIYGEHDRRIICDNCEYKVILGANDPETQRYFADLIGTYEHNQWSIGRQLNQDKEPVGMSMQVSKVRDWMIQPHEFAALDDVIVHSSHGVCRIKKCFSIYEPQKQIRFSVAKPGEPWVNGGKINNKLDNKRNEGANMLSINERAKNASAKVEDAKRKQRVDEKQARESKQKQENRLRFIIGGMVVKAFPELSMIQLGTNEENEQRFRPLEEFFAELSTEEEFKNIIKKIISYNTDGNCQ